MNGFRFLAALNFEVDGLTTLLHVLSNGRFLFIVGLCVAFLSGMVGLYNIGVGA